MKTGKEFRQALIENEVFQYELGGYVGIDPNRVGKLLAGIRPMTPELAARMEAAIATIVRTRAETVAQT